MGQHNISGGVFWQFVPFGSASVIVFFVLSGYVISFVTTSKETSCRSYMVARAGRIYSVALPALLLTAVVDAMRRAWFPAAPAWGDDLLADFGWRLVASALFLNEAWSAHVRAGSDIPYWSMSFEVAYYALFGVATFSRGRHRWLGIGAIMLLAGPRIVALLPCWLCGVAAHRLSSRELVADHLRWPMFVVATAVLVGAVAAAGYPGLHARTTDSFNHDVAGVVQDNLIGVALAAHLVGFNSVSQRFAWLLRGGRPIRAAAATTFGLYLYHMPILTFVAAWLGPLSLAISIGLAQVTESRKGAWQRMMEAG